KKIKFNKHKSIPEVVELIPTRWLFEGIMTGVAKNNYFNQKFNDISKSKLTTKDEYYKGVISYSEYRSEMRRFNGEKSKLIGRYGLDSFSNSVVNLAVNAMDGRYYNTGKNVFLSSFKKIGGHEFRTYNFNLIVILIFIALFGLITSIKLKLFYKE
ncbi:MAG: hypothetical protein U9N34_04260, partial [Candidatus Cloacimonadota bacterium]|nr:hypothetical protein [Candidatus Cloacimonadota bacterium]